MYDDDMHLFPALQAGASGAHDFLDADVSDLVAEFEVYCLEFT